MSYDLSFAGWLELGHPVAVICGGTLLSPDGHKYTCLKTGIVGRGGYLTLDDFRLQDTEPLTMEEFRIELDKLQLRRYEQIRAIEDQYTLDLSALEARVRISHD